MAGRGLAADGRFMRAFEFARTSPPDTCVFADPMHARGSLRISLDRAPRTSEHLEEESKTHGSPGRCRHGIPRASRRGAPSATGMVRLAVRAATQKPRSIVPRRVNARPTREKKNSEPRRLARIGTRAPPDDGTNGMWAGIADEAIAPAGRSNTAKGHRNPMSVVNPAGIDQCPDPGG